MISTLTKQPLSTTLSLLLVIVTTALQVGAQQAGYSGQGVPLSAEQLRQLVAPIALYSDALIAKIFISATVPDQVACAATWVRRTSDLNGQTLMQVVDAQQWNLSAKAVTQSSSVLSNMAKNLSWTSSLGEASQAFNPCTGTHARGASVSNAYGTQSAAQAYGRFSQFPMHCYDGTRRGSR